MMIATAIAALAALGSGRAVAQIQYQQALEDQARAINDAYARIHVALNVINNSGYDVENHNLELRASIAGQHGGTVAGDEDLSEEWLHDPDGVLHGFVRNTDVRVYRARDYVKRLAKLKGEEIPAEVDPGAESDSYFVLEAVGRSRDTTRAVSALVRENEPFSSFVFFQNRHPLGVSGKPRGLIHSNDRLDFYFPRGEYTDSVSAVNGFGYQAGATAENTQVSDANPEAAPISLEQVDFVALREKSNLFAGQPGLDAEIKMYPDGRVRIKQYTPPYYGMVERTYSDTVISGWTQETVMETQDVQVGTTTETRTREVLVGYDYETYTVTVPVYEDREVEKTRQVPIYELQTVTKTRWVKVFVPYDETAEGGTAVGGGGDGVAGEYVWVQEEYQTEENVIVGYTTETYTEIEQVQVGETTEERTRRIGIYQTETYTVEVPVYEQQEVAVTRDVPIYETVTYTVQEEEFFPPVLVDTTYVDLNSGPGTLYIDGRITRLYGDLRGRLTVVGNEKVRVTGNIRYVDDNGNTAMRNGGDYTRPYERNPDYTGNSVLGVIARDDVLLASNLPNQAEINATLMSVEGRVGIDGFRITDAGEPSKDYLGGLTDEERKIEEAYNETDYRTRRFRRDSLRRLGGIISNDRIVETYIRPRKDGTSYVDAGFKRGSMQYDINLLFNPPPNFVEVPRPVVTHYAPVFFMRDEAIP